MNNKLIYPTKDKPYAFIAIQNDEWTPETMPMFEFISSQSSESTGLFNACAGRNIEMIGPVKSINDISEYSFNDYSYVNALSAKNMEISDNKIGYFLIREKTTHFDSTNHISHSVCQSDNNIIVSINSIANGYSTPIPTSSDEPPKPWRDDTAVRGYMIKFKYLVKAKVFGDDYQTIYEYPYESNTIITSFADLHNIHKRYMLDWDALKNYTGDNMYSFEIKLLFNELPILSANAADSKYSKIKQLIMDFFNTEENHDEWWFIKDNNQYFLNKTNGFILSDKNYPEHIGFSVPNNVWNYLNNDGNKIPFPSIIGYEYYTNYLERANLTVKVPTLYWSNVSLTNLSDYLLFSSSTNINLNFRTQDNLTPHLDNPVKIFNNSYVGNGYLFYNKNLDNTNIKNYLNEEPDKSRELKEGCTLNFKRSNYNLLFDHNSNDTTCTYNLKPIIDFNNKKNSAFNTSIKVSYYQYDTISNITYRNVSPLGMILAFPAYLHYTYNDNKMIRGILLKHCGEEYYSVSYLYKPTYGIKQGQFAINTNFLNYKQSNNKRDDVDLMEKTTNSIPNIVLGSEVEINYPKKWYGDENDKQGSSYTRYNVKVLFDKITYSYYDVPNKNKYNEVFVTQDKTKYKGDGTPDWEGMLIKDDTTLLTYSSKLKLVDDYNFDRLNGKIFNCYIGFHGVPSQIATEISKNIKVQEEPNSLNTTLYHIYTQSKQGNYRIKIKSKLELKSNMVTLEKDDYEDGYYVYYINTTNLANNKTYEINTDETLDTSATPEEVVHMLQVTRVIRKNEYGDWVFDFSKLGTFDNAGNKVQNPVSGSDDSTLQISNSTTNESENQKNNDKNYTISNVQPNGMEYAWGVGNRNSLPGTTKNSTSNKVPSSIKIRFVNNPHGIDDSDIYKRLIGKNIISVNGYQPHASDIDYTNNISFFTFTTDVTPWIILDLSKPSISGKTLSNLNSEWEPYKIQLLLSNYFGFKLADSLTSICPGISGFNIYCVDENNNEYEIYLNYTNILDNSNNDNNNPISSSNTHNTDSQEPSTTSQPDITSTEFPEKTQNNPNSQNNKVNIWDLITGGNGSSI